MTLTKSGFKGQIGLQFGGELKNGWEKEKRRRRGRGDQAKMYGTLDFCMETNLDHGIEWIYGTLRLCMIKSLSPNLGFC